MIIYLYYKIMNEYLEFRIGIQFGIEMLIVWVRIVNGHLKVVVESRIRDEWIFDDNFEYIDDHLWLSQTVKGIGVGGIG
jgi:hypothetical protein